MVISSVMEGGANVVSEAIIAGLPVLASDIDGNIGLLGSEYGGYFATQNTADLATLLRRAEENPVFLSELGSNIRKLQPKFKPNMEKKAWRELLEDLGVD